MSYTPRLKEKYTKEIVPVLKEKFKYKSIIGNFSPKKTNNNLGNPKIEITKVIVITIIYK